MARALITGGAGFIGSHLAEALLGAGWTVEIIDNLSTGRVGNVAHLATHPQFFFVVDSIMNRSRMSELVTRADVIFHLAAAVGVRLIVEKPVETIATNINATEIVLELAAEKRKPLLLTSTSEVYGKLEKVPFTEEDDLILGPTSRARWCYAASKIIDEFLAKSYFREHGLPVVIVRLFNTIGPRQTGQYGMVVPRFIERALAGEPIVVYGDGTQSRSFTWVGDVVNATRRLIEVPEAFGEVFNIGNTSEISMYELAVLVKQLTRSDSMIQLVPYEKAYQTDFEDIRRRLPDISKVQRLIGYKPSMDLPDILDRIIEYERTNLELLKRNSS